LFQIRISHEFPLLFYQISENDVIFIQNIEQLSETNNNIEFQVKMNQNDEEDDIDMKEFIKNQMNLLLEVF